MPNRAQYILRDSNRVSATKFGEHGYGGNNRTRQIASLVERAGFDIIDVPEEVGTTRWERYYYGLRCWWKHETEGYRLRYPGEYRPSYTGHRYLRYLKTFRKYPNAAFLLQEEPPRFESYHASQETCFPVLALPHNLETIHKGGSPEIIEGVNPRYSLINEAKHLALANRVFCISREEQWLLNNSGAETDFLPYYPPDQKKKELDAVAARRSQGSSEGDRYFILGSVHNTPAFKGVLDVLNMLQSIWNEDSSFQVDVAGYGTSRIQEEMSLGEGFTVHGTVSPGVLTDLQCRATAQIVHQTYGLGALTRIPEALVARVPVLANAHAARSAYDLEGVYVYQDAVELSNLIGESLPNPSPPSRPRDAERRFIRHARSIGEVSASTATATS